jgi:hypothetical protein
MRVREWYGWHFPELAQIVNDNFQYARVVMVAKDKKNINDEMLEELNEIVGDPEIADQVLFHPVLDRVVYYCAPPSYMQPSVLSWQGFDFLVQS